MNKEKYLEKIELAKTKRKEVDEFVVKVKKMYIEANKPCNIGDEVKITFTSERVDTGVVVSFDVMSDKNVYVSAYKKGSSSKYITVPYKSIEVINKES